MSKKKSIPQGKVENGISRRAFLAGSTATGALALAGLGLAGCSQEGAISSTDPESTTANNILALDPIGEPTESISADVAIIGGGGSGLAASIQASQLGLKPVIIEKTGALGGSYVCTEGVYVINSTYQKEVGVEYSIEDSIAKQMDYHHWITSPSLLRSYYEQINETLDWCDDLGVEFDGLIDMGASEKTVLIWKHDPESTLPGALVVKSLKAAAENAGVESILQAPAKKVLMEDGKVTGVLAEKRDGTVLKVEAPVVIIASGGFAQNREMLAELSHFACTPFDVGVPGREGDGLKMGVDAGAKMWDYPGTAAVSGPVVIGTEWPSLAVLLCLNPLLWINQDCQRFVREDLININFTYAGNAAKLQKRLLVVFTQKDLDHYENVGPYSRVFSLIDEGTPMTGLTQYLMDLKESEGSVYIGDTLEDLAKEADLDLEKLTQSIDRYNGFCDEGLDSDFSKQPKYLNPLEEGPYYALECADVLYGTCGSLTVSPNCECLDKDYEPVSGLYAAGSDAGGLFGDSYDANLAPSSMAGWALNSGRLAAKNAEKYLKG